MKVESSALQAVHYDRSARQLTVEFRDHTCYCYTGVSEQVHRLLLSASSAGNYFNSSIRNRYPCSKIPKQ